MVDGGDRLFVEFVVVGEALSIRDIVQNEDGEQGDHADDPVLPARRHGGRAEMICGSFKMGKRKRESLIVWRLSNEMVVRIERRESEDRWWCGDVVSA